MSNVLEVVLPLDASEIRLPPRGSRSDEEELYLEYLEVNEGSGYLSAMDSKLPCVLLFVFFPTLLCIQLYNIFIG